MKPRGQLSTKFSFIFVNCKENPGKGEGRGPTQREWEETIVLKTADVVRTKERNSGVSTKTAATFRHKGQTEYSRCGTDNGGGKQSWPSSPTKNKPKVPKRKGGGEEL